MLDQELLDEATKALGELPSIYQSVGTLAARARRCKPDSKLGKKLWAKYDELLSQGSEHSSKIRMALHFAKKV